MSPTRARLAAVVSVAFLLAGAAAPAPSAGQESVAEARVEVVVPVSPVSFRGNGAEHLAYELHLTNHHVDDLTLTAVEARGTESSLLLYEGTDLRRVLYRPGRSIRDGLPEVLSASSHAIVFMWIELGDAAAPSTIHHRLTFTRAAAAEEDAAEESATSATAESTAEESSAEAGGRDAGGHARDTLAVETLPIPVGAEPAVLSAPLRGSRWLAANGPANGSGHRRALIPVHGRGAIAQRFAIDWVRLGDDRRTFAGDRLANAAYHAYGAEVLAVADGVVASTKDGIPENVPGLASRAVEITMETIGGNYVILDIGGGRFAFYAHLQPDSLQVAPGDRVRTGQVLGLVGNSGNSTEPHLHFHLGDADSPLGAEGSPTCSTSSSCREPLRTSTRAPASGAPWSCRCSTRSSALPLRRGVDDSPQPDGGER